MFSWCGYLIVSLVFSHLGFWSGNLFLIAPFPDLCLHVPFSSRLYFHYIIGIAKIINNSAGMVLNNDINLNIVEVIGCMLGAV